MLGDTLFFEVFSSTGGPYAIDLRVRRSAEAVDAPFSDGVLRAMMVGDGSDTAWIEIHGWSSTAQTGTFELFASPYAEHAAGLVPRDVTMMAANTLAPMFVGDGYVVLAETPSVLGVYRLTDGARTEIAAPTGNTWDDPHGIHGGEVLVSSSARTTFPQVTDHLMFIELAALSYVVP